MEDVMTCDPDKLKVYLTLVADDPQVLIDFDGTPLAKACIEGVGKAGVIQLARLKICLRHFIERDPVTKKPPFDLKWLFNRHRALFEEAYKSNPRLRDESRALCDRLDGMFLQRWESKCEEMGWYSFEFPKTRSQLLEESEESIEAQDEIYREITGNMAEYFRPA